MSGKPRKQPKKDRSKTPKRLAGPPRLPGPAADAAREAESRRDLHLSVVAGATYGASLTASFSAAATSAGLDTSATAYVRDVLERVGARDPVEEMLVAQLILTHSRVLHLSKLANDQKEIASVRVVNEHADRASNTYRRLMLALAEYRRPPAPARSFTAIGQANIAGQQVVQNGKSHDAREPNEQGCPADDPAALPGGAPAPAALPADPLGPGVAAGLGGAGQAVAGVHRAADQGGQGPVEPERHQAR